jgi:hypothetical protein
MVKNLKFLLVVGQEKWSREKLRDCFKARSLLVRRSPELNEECLAKLATTGGVFFTQPLESS